MSQKVTGQAYVTINGALTRSKEGATLELGGWERESVFDSTGKRVGYKQKPVASKLDMSVIDVAGSDHVADYSDLTNATGQFETDTGNKYLLTGLDCMAPPKINGGDVELKFEGDPAKKI